MFDLNFDTIFANLVQKKILRRDFRRRRRRERDEKTCKAKTNIVEHLNLIAKDYKLFK